MPRIPGLRRYLRPLSRGSRIDADVDAELSFHFERTFEEHARNGRVEWALRLEGTCFRLS